MYRKKWISETEYQLQQMSSKGYWRNASEESAGYLAWIAAGNVPAEVEYVAPPAPPEPTLEELRTAKVREIAEAWQNDVENVGMPILGEGFSVDYGVEDALIWENALGYVDPTATEVEVRAIDNTFHVVSREIFEGIPTLQKAYYAQQLQKKWALQKAADAATDAAEVGAVVWA